MEHLPQQQRPGAPQLVDGRNADGNHGDAQHALLRPEARLDNYPDRRCFEGGDDGVLLLGPKRSGMMCMMCIEGGMLRSLANFRPLRKYGFSYYVTHPLWVLCHGPKNYRTVPYKTMCQFRCPDFPPIFGGRNYGLPSP